MLCAKPAPQPSACKFTEFMRSDYRRMEQEEFLRHAPPDCCRWLWLAEYDRRFLLRPAQGPGCGEVGTLLRAAPTQQPRRGRGRRGGGVVKVMDAKLAYEMECLFDVAASCMAEYEDPGVDRPLFQEAQRRVVKHLNSLALRYAGFRIKAELTAEAPPMTRARQTEGRDAVRLDAVERECWTLECYPEPGLDEQERWQVKSYHMTGPYIRIIGDGLTPREAIDEAMRRAEEGADGDA